MEAEADFNQVISGTNRTRINEKESQPPHHIQKVTQKLHPKKKNHYFVSKEKQKAGGTSRIRARVEFETNGIKLIRLTIIPKIKNKK